MVGNFLCGRSVGTNIFSLKSKEIFEDLIVAAHNDAKSKLKKKTSEEISKVTGGIDLPPGFKLPF